MLPETNYWTLYTMNQEIISLQRGSADNNKNHIKIIKDRGDYRLG